MIKEERTMRGDPPGVECWLLPSQRHFVGCAMEISIVCCKSITNLRTRVDFVVAHNGEYSTRLWMSLYVSRQRCSTRMFGGKLMMQAENLRIEVCNKCVCRIGFKVLRSSDRPYFEFKFLHGTGLGAVIFYVRDHDFGFSIFSTSNLAFAVPRSPIPLYLRVSLPKCESMILMKSVLLQIQAS